MGWVIGAASLVIGLLLLSGLVMRYNQLSLGRALALEGRRQLAEDIADRHLLIPAFIEAASTRVGMSREVEELGAAFTAARSADTIAQIGAAEQEITAAIEELALVVRERVQAAENGTGAAEGQRLALGEASVEAEATSRFLYVQLRVFESRIAAAVRYYNLNVHRFLHRRARLLSLPLRAAFPAFVPMTYVELRLDPVLSSERALEALGEERRADSQNHLGEDL